MYCVGIDELGAMKRSLIFATGEIYHIFNRGIERRHVYTGRREYERMMLALWFYRYSDPGMTLSAFMNLSGERRKEFSGILQHKPMGISLLTHCLMPNHFHLVMRQEEEGAIRRFVGNITNSYTKYFNVKHFREGPLFQGSFRAVRVETEEQLVHLTRYIHLNPVTSYLCTMDELIDYPWSSYREFLGSGTGDIINMPAVDSLISRRGYASFVRDQAAYAEGKNKILQLMLDEES